MEIPLLSMASLAVAAYFGPRNESLGSVVLHRPPVAAGMLRECILDCLFTPLVSD